MADQKYYAVKRGLTPGIYYSWEECETHIKGVTDPKYKECDTWEEAEEYLGFKPVVRKEDVMPENFCFVDGSFNPATNVYGWGGFLSVAGKKYKIQGHGSNPAAAESRNVAGEIMGANHAIKGAIKLGLKELTVYYDYEGIEKWATGEWQAKKDLTQRYKTFIDNAKQVINLNFVHVPAHTGIEGNELADQLAKQAVGIQ